jgi:hypothetical protein
MARQPTREGHPKLLLNAGLKPVLACLTVVTLSPAVTAQAVAPVKVPVFNDEIIRRAIQCEVGHFARLVRSRPLNRDHLKAAYTISERHEINREAKFLVPPFIPHLDRDDGAAPSPKLFNIDVANELACDKDRGLELLDLRKCLADGAEGFASSAVKCRSRMHVKKTTDAGGKPVFFVTFGTHAIWGEDFTQEAEVVSPPPRRDE